jgi:hypothetical protein
MATGQPITNYQQAVDFANSELGKKLPIWKLMDDINYYSVGTGSRGKHTRKYAAPAIAALERVRQDPVGYVKSQGLTNYISYYTSAVRDHETAMARHKPLVQKEIDLYKGELSKALSFLIENKTPAVEIQKIVDDYIVQRQISAQQNQPKPSFMDKVFGVAENLIVGGLTGGLGLSAIQVAGLNSALAIANGAKVEDALKAGLAGLAAGQVGQYLQTVNAITDNPIVNSAITNAAQSAAAATVLGQDVKTAALAGLAGGAAAGTLYKASDNAAISRAAGEYTQAIISGYSPQAAMMAALSGFADTEVAEARQKLETNKDVQKATKVARTAAIDEAVPYRPQYGFATAELAGSEIGGKPVSDVSVSAGNERDPKLFDKGDMRRPVGAAVSDLYEVKNNLGETFQARDITYQNGEVQRIIFDPATGTYKQQMLKDLPSQGPDTLPGVTVTGQEDDGVNEAAELLAFLKPQTKEFSRAITNLPSQDLLDLTNLLATGATSAKDSVFSAENLTNLQKVFSSSEAKAVELEKAAIANPTAENIAAAKAAQNEAITAKFQLSQALVMPGIDPLKADLSNYNRYPEATKKFVDQGRVVYAKGDGTPDSPLEILGEEPYGATELKLFLQPTTGAPSTTGGVNTSASDLSDLQALSAIRGQPVAKSLLTQMNSAKAAANNALVALQSANTPETIQAARDALANYTLSQKMYSQVAGEELPVLPDEKLASQEFPLVDEAIKTNQMIALGPMVPVNARMQRRPMRSGLPGQTPDNDPSLLTDINAGLVTIPRAEFEYMQPNVLARGGLASLRR